MRLFGLVVVALALASFGLSGPPKLTPPAAAPMPNWDATRHLATDATHIEGVLSFFYRRTNDEECGRECWLTEPAGARWKLTLPRDLALSLPSDNELVGQYVRVEALRKAEDTIEVAGMSRVPREYWPKSLKSWSGRGSSLPSLLDSQLGPKPYVTIPVKFADLPTEPYPLSYYQTMMGMGENSVGDWFGKVSYGAITLQGSIVTSYKTLPGTVASYKKADGTYDLRKMMDDAIALVDSTVDFRAFYGINIVTNSNMVFGGGGWETLTLDGETRTWGTTVNNLPQPPNLMEHEMGHSLGIRHSGDQFGDQYGSPFDVMGKGGNSTFGYAYHAFHRWSIGWIPESNAVIVWPGESKVIKLERRTDPQDLSATRIIRVYMAGYASHYFTLESIKGGKYECPSTGVALGEVDENRVGDSRGTDFLRIIDANNTGSLFDAGSLLQPGKTYSNPSNGLTVTVVSSGATSYTVQVTVSPNTLLATTVKSNGDTGAFTLREAITFANRHPGQTIKFNLSASQLSGGVARIYPKTWLPDITGANTTIDGESQTTFGGNTNVNGPEVCLDGTLAGDYVTGLLSRSANTALKGLVLCKFKGNGFLADGSACSGARVTGCYIGCDPTGMIQAKNNWEGIRVTNGAKGAVIGTAASGNLVSGNGNWGVSIDQSGSDNAVIENNIIGLNRTGYGSLSGPQMAGIAVMDGPHNTLIRGNTIGGHVYAGIDVFGPNVSDTLIKGNRIGTLINGSNKAGNKTNGIAINARTTDTTGPQNTAIGGASPADRNVIGGNTYANIFVGHQGTSGVRILGNYIGIGANGSSNVGGGAEGIVCQLAGNVVIGGTAAGEGNLVGFNAFAGIWVTSNNVQVLGNKVGFTAAGLAAKNNGAGIAVSDCVGAIVGGSGAGAGNSVGNTGQSGISVWNGDNAVVQGNVIGLDASMRAAPITYEGIVLGNGTTGAQIGGGAAGARNTIGCALKGIALWNAGTKNNLVQGNWIGFSQDGLQVRAIGESGIILGDACSANTIGGATAALGNTIGSFANDGIVVIGSTGNTIQNNLIGVSTRGISSPGLTGVGLVDGANSNIVKANIIPRATNSGVWTYKASSNKIHGNLIGFMPDGVTNGLIGDRGVLISELSSNNEVGGNGAGLGNRIGNAKSGVAIFNCSGTKVYGNTIGLGSTGAAAPITEEGIGIYSGSTFTVAGASGAGANIISNCQNGVGMWGDTTLKNTIRFNQIFGNRTLGINLLKNDSAGGVTLNDSLDADTGPNGLQNFPVISSLTGGTAAGSFSSKASSTYTIDFYSSTAAGVSGYGEGKTYLGSLPVTTNASGTATFSKALSVAVGAWVAATATDSTGSTSEFSLAVKRVS